MYSEQAWNNAKSLKNLDRTTAVRWWYVYVYYEMVSFRYVYERIKKKHTRTTEGKNLFEQFNI